MEVIEIDGQNARVGLGGVVRDIRLDILDERPEIGDYVIVHAGRITLQLWKEMGAIDEVPE